MPITAEVAKKIAPKPYPDTVRALADKWGPVFDVDPSWIITHAAVESNNRPLAFNESGNAWGLLQIKPGTASDIVRWMKAQGVAKDPKVLAVLKAAWRGQPQDLLNPEINVMLGTFYLSYIKKMFGTDDHEIVAAAYNQGPGSVRKAVKKGSLQKPAFTPEHKKYLAAITDAKERGFV